MIFLYTRIICLALFVKIMMRIVAVPVPTLKIHLSFSEGWMLPRFMLLNLSGEVNPGFINKIYYGRF